MKTILTKPMMILLQGAVLLALPTADAAPGNESRTAIPAATQPQEVYTIDQPGSYYLGGNRYATGTAIRIQTNDVTLDLNGFALLGAGGDKTHGVFLSGVRNVEIRNGTITRFGDRGIAGERQHEGVRIAHLRLVDNGACGICLDATGLVMTDCYVSGNKMSGICPGVCSSIRNNVVSSNGHSGVFAGWGALVEGNSVYGNQHAGIFANCNSRVENNMVINNNLSAKTNEAGIVVREGTLVRNNVLRDNKLTGIRALAGSNRIEGNVVTYSKAEGSVGIASKPDANNELRGNCCSTNCAAIPAQEQP